MLLAPSCVHIMVGPAGQTGLVCPLAHRHTVTPSKQQASSRQPPAAEKEERQAPGNLQQTNKELGAHQCLQQGPDQVVLGTLLHLIRRSSIA